MYIKKKDERIPNIRKRSNIALNVSLVNMLWKKSVEVYIFCDFYIRIGKKGICFNQGKIINLYSFDSSVQSYALRTKAKSIWYMIYIIIWYLSYVRYSGSYRSLCQVWFPHISKITKNISFKNQIVRYTFSLEPPPPQKIERIIVRCTHITMYLDPIFGI